MSVRNILISLSLVVGLATPAAADWPVGLWQSTPDRTGAFVHVRTKPCGEGICGKVERAKNRLGYDRPSNLVGRRMVLGMQPQPDGTYLGRVWEPEGNRVLSARMRVEGDQMSFENCEGGACRTVIWTRVR